MKTRLVILLASLVMLLPGCNLIKVEKDNRPIRPRGEGGDNGESQGKILSSVYTVKGRGQRLDDEYGLYSYVILFGPNENSLKMLETLLETTNQAANAKIDKPNLNLLVLPVKDAAVSQIVASDARVMPTSVASAIAHYHYDYGYAEWIYSKVCRSENTDKEACGDQSPVGPFIITFTKSVESNSYDKEKILIVDLTNTHPSAIKEIVAAYRRQILKNDFFKSTETESWRLVVLNGILNAADLLPHIKKAFAGEF